MDDWGRGFGLGLVWFPGGAVLLRYKYCFSAGEPQPGFQLFEPARNIALGFVLPPAGDANGATLATIAVTTAATQYVAICMISMP